ncbi:MAG: lipopolysaccharide biosynthesis protein [Planctomycetota bacterium]
MPVDAAATDITKGSQRTAAKAVADSGPHNLKRLVSQFAILSLAEVICRLISLVVVVELARRVGRDGYGRIEFSFNIVFWLIFVLRDGVELVFCREVAKRPRPKPRLVNAFLSLKLFLAIVLWLFLAILSLVIFRQWHDRVMLCSYGALLMTTALGLDNVFRGREKPGIVALSLVVRSSLYACGVWFWVHDRSRLEWVPWLLAGAEFLGIMIVWVRYSLEFGIPRPRWRHGRRFGAAVLSQGKSVLGIQLTQVILSSLDVVIVGVTDTWSMVGLYGAPHRLVTAAVTFGLIFQQVLLPYLVRSWSPDTENRSASILRIVRLALCVIVPCTMLVSLVSRYVIDTIFTMEFDEAWPLLAIGIWRVPLLAVSSIHITTLVASHREREGLRVLVKCVIVALPMVIFMHFWKGLIGTSCAMVCVSMIMALWTGHLVHSPELAKGNQSLDGSRNSSKKSQKPALIGLACFLVLIAIIGFFDRRPAQADLQKTIDGSKPVPENPIGLGHVPSRSLENRTRPDSIR